MKSNKILMSVICLSAIALSGCNKTSDSTSTSTSTGGKTSTSTSVDSSTSSGPMYDDLGTSQTLNMSVFYDTKNNATKMKYYEDSKLTLPYASCDGTTYNAGDLKPVWKALQKNLNFTINDVTSTTSGKDIKAIFTEYQTAGFKSGDKQINIAQGNSDQIISEGTNNNTILDLSKYLDKMPNFKSFLADNPVVKKTIMDPNGHIYYAPYFDGFDDIERMLMVRTDWVSKLLDGDLPTNLDTATKITSTYTATMPDYLDTTVDVLNTAQNGKTTIAKKYDSGEGIIAKMKGLSEINGSTAVKALRDYIDKTYNKAYGTKRSDLFCGGNAAYDVDELVALFRCVKANPYFLTGDATKDIVPLFPRAATNDRTSDLWRLASFFGVRGVDSRNGYMYVGSDGKLHDARGTAEMRDALKHMHEMYQEGLILEDFTTKGTVTAGNDDFRAGLLEGDRGFATFDYNQTTTIYNDDAKCSVLDDGKFNFSSILPAVADYKGNGTYIHYTESWRSVKTQGWFITSATASDQGVLKRCLDLFDYLYSDVGNRLMSYGPDAYLAKNTDGTIKTMDYQGKQVPVLSDACKTELSTLAGGNYTNYYRFYVGATYPVGYVKQQGMEYQTVSKSALPYLNTINQAIAYGVLQHVNHKDDNTDHLYDIVPTTLPFTAAENTTLSDTYTDLEKCINNNKGKTNVYSTIVMKGFGSGADYQNQDFSYENFCTTVKTALKCDSYTKIYNDAYTRFKAL